MTKKSVSGTEKKGKFRKSQKRKDLRIVGKQQLESRRIPNPKAMGYRIMSSFLLKKKKKVIENLLGRGKVQLGNKVKVCKDTED